MGNTDAMCLVEASCIYTKFTITAAALRVNYFKDALYNSCHSEQTAVGSDSNTETDH
jgi:hypothetical protein